MRYASGGSRARLIADSYRVMIVAALNDLHWFDTGRRNAPLQLAEKPDDWQETVAPNTVSITMEDRYNRDGGLGNEPFDRSRLYVDFFAENESVGTHVAHDLRDVIKGIHPQAERTGTDLTVYDLLLDPPVGFTRVDLVNVRVDRATGFPRPWQRHWFVISCYAEDEFLDDLDHDVVVDPWSDSLNTAWTEIMGQPTEVP